MMFFFPASILLSPVLLNKCQPAAPGDTLLRCAMVAAVEVTARRLQGFKRQRFNSVAIDVKDASTAAIVSGAAKQIRNSGMGLFYWIEVGRNAAMADTHPEWMASLQGHPEWRRLFPNAPKPGEGEIVKTYPWTPLYYQETLEAHLKRVGDLLSKLPKADGIFLNDLQAAPSACGCGNSLCRWTTDYGPIATATRLGNDAAGKFISAVKKLTPETKIIPVWLSECEENEKETHCGGVGCFAGTCWFSFTEQLMPVANQCERIGALLTAKSLGKTDAEGGKSSGWIPHAIASFADMPPKRKGSAIRASRIVAVLQGWDVTQKQIEAQVDQCKRAGVGGYIVAFSKIEQSWEPRIYKVKGSGLSASPLPSPN